MRPCIGSALFCDIAQSTRFASVLGENEYGQLLHAFQSLGLKIVDDFAVQGYAFDADIRGDQICVIAYEPAENGDAERDACELVKLARDLKVAWFFSHYNRERVKGNRAPVQIMCGIHTGKLSVDSFARSRETGKETPEGYAISIAKRVESAARHGKSWQIMITDPTLERVRKHLPVEYIRRTEATLCEGLTYPVNEILDIQTFFKKPLSMVDLKEDMIEEVEGHLKAAIDLDPIPWHYLLWSSWNLYRPIESQDNQSHNTALHANPEAVGLAQRAALLALHMKKPWEARILLDRAEKRSGERRYSLGYHSIISTMENLMSEEQAGVKIDCQSILRRCTSAYNDEEWRYAAFTIFSLLVAEGHTELKSIPTLPEIHDSKMRSALEIVFNGLNLVKMSHSSPDISFSENLETWQQQVADAVGRGLSTQWHKARIDALKPIFSFYADVNEKKGLSDAQTVYKILEHPQFNIPQI